ncbi:uncharacterized protein LOC143248297 isoform X2 [Tachypleus tridentatus]|uniref:uncharacterized protein LOC143248297 isoform X2 n=1 Tax=Tachypleus tridentatus TaxID=6853 RepID=UPI003FD1E1EE
MLWETFERGRIISWYHPRFNTNSLFYKYRHSYLITGKISEHHISLLEPAIPTVLGFAAKPALSTAYSFHLLDVHPKIIVNMMKRQLILLLLLWPISCTVGIEEDELSLITNTWKTNTEKRNMDMFNEDSSLCSSVVNAVGCYIDSCVPSFLECCRLAENRLTFLRCKQTHRNCIVSCFRDSKKLLAYANALH